MAFAWYRSIEFFWHDDFAGVDWDQRVKGDFRAIIEIVNNEFANKNMLENASKKEYLRSRIKLYPSSQKNKIETAVISFINYQSLVNLEMSSIVNAPSEKKKIIWDESNEMKIQRSLFEPYFTAPEIKIMLESQSGVINKLRQDSLEVQDDAELEEFERKFRDLAALYKAKAQDCFKSIFEKQIQF